MKSFFKKYGVFLFIAVVVVVFTIILNPMLFKADLFEGQTIDSDMIQGYTKEVEKAEITKETLTLPKGDIFSVILPQIIKLSISVLASVMFIYLTVAGILLVSGGVDEANIESAKKILTYMIVGALIITVSLSLVYAITQINWFG